MIFVSDLDYDLTCKVSKLADNTNIARKGISTLGKEFLQTVLDKLSNWTGDWQMEFNVENCSYAH